MAGAAAGFLGDILIISFPSITLPNPYVLTDSGDHKTFNNPTGSQRYWDDSATLTVQTTTDGGSSWNTMAAGTYTIRYTTGQVVLNSALTGTPGCRLTAGKYCPYVSIGYTTNWDVQPAVKAVDATTHKGVGGSPFEDYVLTTMGGIFVFKKWWIDETFITYLTTRQRLITSCIDPVGGRYESYGYLTDNSISLVQNGLVDETITFQCSGPIAAI